ncbi:DUF6932 family protein [Shewanella frigidimarina]|uniref:DUF6932 family protein n=1 Tax=Shewanella frigidimarina TaxID=56812 RepID=UPI003D7AE671|tara:strand:+ start:264 stop:728 length:465 start_codon:yes stop_codon:yes gene_type:complete
MSVTFIDLPKAPWPVLKEGIHTLSIEEFRDIFVFNPHRRKQFYGLLDAIESLKQAGCSNLYIDGSYVTQKPLPGDYDACWDASNVDIDKLDSVFLEFENGRKAQKQRYEGEFFPAHWPADRTRTTSYLSFFQREKHSGSQKGIVLLKLDDLADS